MKLQTIYELAGLFGPAGSEDRHSVKSLRPLADNPWEERSLKAEFLSLQQQRHGRTVKK